MSVDGQWLRGKRILIVEDEILIALPLLERLEFEGAVIVGPAAAPQRALELISNQAIDAAVLDMNLAGTYAWSVADRLKLQSIPFVFVTGYVDDDFVPDGLRGVSRLSKPAAPDAVLKALYRAVAGG